MDHRKGGTGRWRNEEWGILEEALQETKSCKASGPTGMNGELIKYGSQKLKESFFSVVNLLAKVINTKWMEYSISNNNRQK